MSTRSFTSAWLAGDPAATAFLAPGTREGVRTAATRRAGRTVHPDVIASLRVVHPAQSAHRAALANGASCVVTGQQVGLFGGPLYTLYKAAAAIVDARAISEETGAPCVPVFWLQNEDHDYNEIAACTVLSGSNELVTLRAHAEGEPCCPVRARRYDESLGAALASLDDALDGLPHADEVSREIRAHWRTGAAPDVAFRGWLERLFAPHGLLIVDPSDATLDDAARRVHAHAIASMAPIATALRARADALTAAGFGVQVHVRPDSPLCFVHPHGANGPRYRACRDGHGWRTPDGEPIDAAVVEGGPYSTSALLRPILQDTWLPTVAYVGGPGEIAYFAQLPPLYELLGLPMPAITHRARFDVVDAPARRLLGQLDLPRAALAEGRDALVARLASTGVHPDPDALLASLTEGLTALDALEPYADALDLHRALDKTQASIRHSAGRLVERYRRALAQTDDVAMDRLDRLLARLRPNDAPQERIHGWPAHAARFGIDALTDAILEAVVPFDATLQELAP